MATDKGVPLAGELAPSPPSKAPPAPALERPPKCVACGGWHGGVGAGIACLENEIHRLRAVLAPPTSKGT